MLLSLPGSGNTWTRLLIEYASGAYTGSVYNDTEFLLNIFPGEAACDSSVAAVKTHKVWGVGGGGVARQTNGTKPSCIEPLARSRKTVIVLRHPLDACWAEFQRRLTGGSHFKRLQNTTHNLLAWAKVALKLARSTKSFAQDLRVLYANRAMKTLTVRYEDLLNPARAAGTLTRMINFLGLSNRTSASQVRCAFALAEHDKVHRSSTPSNDYMLKSRAFTKDVVCSMWAIMGTEAEELGYAPYDFKC